MEFTNTTFFPFQPGLSNAVAVDSTGERYQTPAAFREKLRDLVRLTYVRMRWRYRVELSASSAGGSADLILRAGSADKDTVTLDLSSAQTFEGERDVDLSDVKGATELSGVLSVTGAADAGITAQVAVQLEVTHPLVIAGRC